MHVADPEQALHKAKEGSIFFCAVVQFHHQYVDLAETEDIPTIHVHGVGVLL